MYRLGTTGRKVGTLRKGALLSLEGRLQTRSWEDKQTSQKKYITEVICVSVMPEEALGGGIGAARAVLKPAKPALTPHQF